MLGYFVYVAPTARSRAGRRDKQLLVSGILSSATLSSARTLVGLRDGWKKPICCGPN